MTALLEFASGAQVTFCMSWDVWKHSHPAIEIYGSEGSLRVPDPNFFGGQVEITERGGDWRAVDSSDMPLGAPNWRSPNWAPEMPNKANYRALGLADLASAVLNGTPHRSSGRLGLHVLEVMHSILEGAATGQPQGDHDDPRTTGGSRRCRRVDPLEGATSGGLGRLSPGELTS